MIRRPAPSSRLRRVAGAALVAGVLAVTTGCGSDGVQNPLAPDETTPESGETAPEPEPEPEPAPEPEPEPEPAPEPEPEPEPEVDDDDDGTNALLGLLLLLLAIGVVLALILAGRRSPKRTTTAPRPSARSELLAGARWVHDVGTMELLRTSDPIVLAQTWQTVATQMVTIENRANALVGATDDPAAQAALQRLGIAMSGARAAFGQDVAIRTDPTQAVRADLVQAAAQTAQQRRYELDIAINDPALRGA